MGRNSCEGYKQGRKTCHVWPKTCHVSWFVTVKFFLKPPKSCHVWAKRVTIHFFENLSAQKSCHVLANVSRFGLAEWTSILTQKYFETLQRVAKPCHFLPRIGLENFLPLIVSAKIFLYFFHFFESNKIKIEILPAIKWWVASHKALLYRHQLDYHGPLKVLQYQSCNALSNYLIILLDDIVYVYILYDFDDYVTYMSRICDV